MWPVRPAGLVPLLLSLSSCLQIGLPDDRAATPITASVASDAGAVEASATVPAGCAVDPRLGIALCRTTALCPALLLDPDLYPDCGFRHPSIGIVVECVCDDALCPVGSALDCNQARSLIADQSQLLTCIQRSEGRCASLSSAAR
jgi:hypothetical protein